MKKSWLSLLLALALAMCLACGAALAEGEGPDLQFYFSNDKGNNTVPIGIVPPEAQHIISAADWMGELNIGNFDEMTAAYPGIGDVQRNWSIELVSGPDMQAYIEYWGDVVSDAVLHFGRQPESACDIVYRVTCEWDGHTTSTEYTFHAFMLTDLPTGNTLQELYVAQPGETLSVLGDLIPENWLVPGREDDHNFFGLWEYDHTNQNPGVDYTVSEDGYNTATFTSTNPGLYEFNGFISRGNVCGGDTVFVLVPQDNNPVQIFASDTEVTTLENYTIKVAAPGAEAVRVYLFTGEQFDGGEYEPEGPYWETDSQVLVCGDWSDCTSSYVYAASACFDGEWTDCRDCTVRVNIAAENGSLTGELITLSTLEIQPNESIDITVNQIENAERASKWLFGQNADSPEIPGDGFGTETVSGNDLTPGGIYTVGANAMAYGYEHTFQRAWFMVNYENASISDDHNSTLTIRTPGTEVETCTAHPFTLYAPGADAVEYRLYWAHGEGEMWDWGGAQEAAPGLYVPNGLYTRYAGLYLLQARAHYPDSDWTSFEDCQIEFNVIAPYGNLPVPNAWSPMLVEVDAPQNIYFDWTENAQNYSYWYRLEDGGDSLGDGGFDADENTQFPVNLTIPAENLEAGKLYRVMMDVNAPGYAEGHKEDLFIVDGNPDPSIILNGPDSVVYGQTFSFYVEAPGADEVIVYSSVDGPRHRTENVQEGFDEVYIADYADPAGDTFYIWAAAHIDGSWNHVTECKAVQISASQGMADAPSFSLTNTDVLRGDFVKATLGAVSQDAYAYNVFFNDENGEWRGDYGRNSAGDIYIPTYNLTPGTYTVHGYVRANGYQNGESAQDLTFTVSDPDDYPGGLYVLNTELQTGEKMVWSLYAKYADRVALCVTDNEDSVNRPEENWWHDQDGDCMYSEWFYDRFNHPGTYYVYIGGHFEGENGGYWDYVSHRENFAPVEVHVTAPNGALPSPNAGMPDKAYLGDTVTLHFDETQGAAVYSYWIHTDDSDEWIAGEERWEPGDFQIDTNALQGSGVYWVEMDVNGPGYSEGHGTLHLAVLDGNDQELSRDGFYFSVSSTAVDTNQDVHFIYYMPGAEAVRLIYGSPDEWGEEREGPGISKWDSWDTDCVVPVYAAARFDGNWTEPELICSILVGDPQITINGGEDSFSIDFALFNESDAEGCWMWHDNWINSFSIDNYDGLYALYGCEPEMTIAWAEDSEVQDKEIDFDVFDGNCGANLWLHEYPDHPCTGKLILTVRWGNQELNYPIYVNYRNADSLPTGMNGPDEVHVYMHGDSPVSEWDNVEVTFADGFSFGSRTMLYVHMDAAEHMEFRNDWGSSTIYFNGYDPGTYFGQLEIRDGNIALSKDVIFIIHNEDGTAPDAIHPVFTDESAYECTYTRAAFEDGQFYCHDGWVRNYEIANWEVFAIQRHTHPVWTAEIIGDDHGAEIWFDTWDWEGLTATRGFDVGFNNEPTEPCTIRYKVTCTWDNDVIEGYCTLNYVTPDSLPVNPLDLPTEFRGLHVGEEFGYPVEVLGGYEFGDPDHVRVMITADFADGHHWEWGDNGQRWQFFTPRESGVFHGSSGLVFENIRLDQEILFIVEDENSGDGSIFTLSATEIMTGDPVTAQVYAPGAERIRLSKVNGNGDTVHTFEQEGDSGIDDDMGEWWPGAFTVTAEAYYADQNAWQQVGEPSELTVTTHGDMDFFASELPALVWAGDESIVFRFDDCGNIVGGEHEDAPMGWFKLCINDTMQPDFVVNYDYDWNDAGEHVITPDMYLDGRTLEAGHVYWFGVSAWRPHYTPGGSIEIQTAVVDPDKVLRLPAGMTEIDEEAFAGTSAQAVFIPAGVTSIGSRAFADSAIVYAEVPAGLDIGNAFEGCHNNLVIEWYDPN